MAPSGRGRAPLGTANNEQGFREEEGEEERKQKKSEITALSK